MTLRTKPDTGTAHTEGHWMLERHPNSPTIGYVSSGPDKSGDVATTWNDEGLVRARLIAAAPELLQALKGLLADIEDYQRINNLGGEDNHWQVISRAAIAKAEGRQP